MADAGDNPAPVVVQAPPSIHHEVATGIVSGLSAQPTLLLIMLINVTFVLGAAYFLIKLEDRRASTIEGLLDLINTCVVQQRQT